MNLNRRCLNCGKEFRFDPLDGLPRYCEDCYYALGLGNEPGEEYQGGDQGAAGPGPCDPGEPGEPGPPGPTQGDNSLFSFEPPPRNLKIWEWLEARLYSLAAVGKLKEGKGVTFPFSLVTPCLM